MGDRIVGIAILKTGVLPHTLWVRCHRDRLPNNDFTEDLPVYPKGTTKPCDPAWAYEIRGNMIHVTPSVHVR
jgi:hypothetical protein